MAVGKLYVPSKPSRTSGPRDGRAMGEAFESPSAFLDGDVTDQLVDKQRQRANRHTPAAAMLTDWSSPLDMSS